jgi:sulfonate transport system substrate-binding protein
MDVKMVFSSCPFQSRLRVLVLLAWLGATAVSARAAAAPLAELRIGYQKSSVNLLIARRLNLVERRFPGMRVRWAEFGAGPQLLEALGAGSLDFGMTGDTPPIFAQAAGRDVLYVGHETPKPDSSAILVLAGSRIESLRDLRGKRVAFQKGSSAHYLVLRALAKVGLRLSDIQPVYLAPADARAALERDGVDAWAIWDPYWAAVATGSRARVLTTGMGLADDVSFYESSAAFAREHADAIRSLFDAINDADRYVQSHPGESTELVAAALGLDLRAAHDFLGRRRQSPVSLLTPPVIAGQQAIADAFVKEGILPRQIKVADVVWHTGRASAPAALR